MFFIIGTRQKKIFLNGSHVWPVINNTPCKVVTIDPNGGSLDYFFSYNTNWVHTGKNTDGSWSGDANLLTDEMIEKVKNSLVKTGYEVDRLNTEANGNGYDN